MVYGSWFMCNEVDFGSWWLIVPYRYKVEPFVACEYGAWVWGEALDLMAYVFGLPMGALALPIVQRSAFRSSGLHCRGGDKAGTSRTEGAGNREAVCMSLPAPSRAG